MYAKELYKVPLTRMTASLSSRSCRDATLIGSLGIPLIISKFLPGERIRTPRAQTPVNEPPRSKGGPVGPRERVGPKDEK